MRAIYRREMRENSRKVLPAPPGEEADLYHAGWVSTLERVKILCLSFVRFSSDSALCRPTGVNDVGRS